LGIGDWGLGIGDWAQSPIPNPQSPIPNIFINNLFNSYLKSKNHILILIYLIPKNIIIFKIVN